MTLTQRHISIPKVHRLADNALNKSSLLGLRCSQQSKDCLYMDVVRRLLVVFGDFIELELFPRSTERSTKRAIAELGSKIQDSFR